LPEDEELVISYVLETSNLTPLDAKLEKGEFSYLENDQSKKTKLPVELISGNSDLSSDKTNTESVNNAINQPTVNATNTESVVSNNAVDTPITKNENNNVIAKKEGNVLFLVQIGAFRAAIATETLAKKFNLSENIKSEMAEGYNKFMVGNFNEYKLARNHRETIKQKGCASAFVAAYNGPKRITVQEALMITNQRWFK
jgi:cell division protein FtsN